jgi:tetratricopeptide (TPR) repeat protein
MRLPSWEAAGVVEKGVRRWVLGLVVSMVCAPAARAHDEPPRAEHVSSSFWEAARKPEARRVDTLLRQGRAQLYPALGLGLMLGADLSAHRRAAVENAIARFERARTLAPDDPEVLYLCGKALSLWERRSSSGRIEKKSREAIARFEALRKIDALYEAADVAFELGVLFTREGEFTRAAEEYSRALTLRIDEASRGVILGNLAEVTMMSGDLEEAVGFYERAIHEGGADERLLSLWGLAVALDRLGEHGEAMERARRALRDDQRPMGVLKQSSVFFVPPYEAHYYDGLGLLALAEEQAGEARSAEAIARDAAKALARATSPTTLAALKQVLVALGDEGERVRVAALLPLVDKALARTQPKGRPEREPKRPVSDEAAPEDREVRVILSIAQSLRAFTRYLGQGGKSGPWADDAEAHIETLASWFAPAAKAKAP